MAWVRALKICILDALWCNLRPILRGVTWYSVPHSSETAVICFPQDWCPWWWNLVQSWAGQKHGGEGGTFDIVSPTLQELGEMSPCSPHIFYTIYIYRQMQCAAWIHCSKPYLKKIGHVFRKLVVQNLAASSLLLAASSSSQRPLCAYTKAPFPNLYELETLHIVRLGRGNHLSYVMMTSSILELWKFKVYY